MQLSFTEKKNIRKNFGKLKESLSIPNLIEVQKNSYKELTDHNEDSNINLIKGFNRVFKSIFPIEDINEKATLEYVSYRLEKPKFDTEECISRGLTYSSALKCTLRLVVYEIYSNVAFSFKSSIGKIFLKTLLNPFKNLLSKSLL